MFETWFEWKHFPRFENVPKAGILRFKEVQSENVSSNVQNKLSDALYS